MDVFSVMNPVCHASVPASLSLSLSLSLSIHPSFSSLLHIYLSLPQVGKLIALSYWEKGSLWGQPLKHRSARPSVLMKS